MEFAAMKNRGVKLFNRILNYVGCTNISYGAGSCVCFCRRAGGGSSFAGSGGCCPVQSCSLNSCASHQRFQLHFGMSAVLVSVTPDCTEGAGVCALWRLPGEDEDGQQGLCPLLWACCVRGCVTHTWHLRWSQGPRAGGFCCWGCAVPGWFWMSACSATVMEGMAQAPRLCQPALGCSCGMLWHLGSFQMPQSLFVPLASPAGKVGCSLMGFPGWVLFLAVDQV